MVPDGFTVEDVCKELAVVAETNLAEYFCCVHGYCIVSDETVWLVLERAAGDMLNLRAPLFSQPIVEQISVLLEFARPVAYLHNHSHVVHRDIKPQNFLYVVKRGLVVLADFGHAKDLAIVGNSETTINYSAPEVLGETKLWTQKADIYSLGMSFYYFISGRIPFEDEQDPEALARKIISGERPMLPAETPEAC